MLVLAVLAGFVVCISAQPQCPARDGKDSVYFPDETDCSRFYQCSNGVAYLHKCPSGLNFDPRINVCVWPADYSCSNPDNPPPRPEKCPEVDGPDSVYFPDRRNCSNFYQCSNGKAYLHRCPSGLNWDPRIQVCVWPSQYACQKPINPPPPPTKCPARDGKTPVYLPDSTSCSRFFECSNGVAYRFNCPAGLNWDPRINVCVWPAEYACTNPDNSPSHPTKCPAVDGKWPVYFADTKNCSRFYQCSNGKPYLHSCPASLNFDPRINVCVWPAEYECSSPVNPPPHPSTCPERDGKFPVYFPDRRRCSRFYQCSNGQAYLQRCPRGLNWDPNTQVCVWPSQYTCRRRRSMQLFDMLNIQPTA